MTAFLGGSATPIGGTVQYVEAPFERVLGDLVRWRQEPPLSQQLEVSEPQPSPQVLDSFVPFQSPWTRELLLPCGDWTAYLNNAIGGGDPTASIGVIAERLGVRHVLAMNTPRHGPGHQATQLWVCGPSGGPPLMSERTLAAQAEDGR